MYYELGTMVRIRKDASPFVNHEKGIGHPRFDVIGKIVGIRPTILSYTVRLSKKFTLTFYQDDIYELPDCISSRHDMFHKMISTDKANQPFYYSTEFESFIDSEKRLLDRRLIDPDIKKYCEHDCRVTYETFKNVYPEYFPGYHFTPVRSPLKALEELNRREFERIAASPIRIEIDDEIKAHYSKEEIKKMINNTFGVSGTYTWNLYKKIIFNGPCTIILWTDGSKTIAKASSDEEVFDPEKGVAICFMKKMLGHTETNKILRKASEQYEDYLTENRPNSSLDEFIEYLSSLKSKTKSVDQSTIDEVKKVEEEQQDE